MAKEDEVVGRDVSSQKLKKLKNSDKFKIFTNLYKSQKANKTRRFLIPEDIETFIQLK